MFKKVKIICVDFFMHGFLCWEHRFVVDHFLDEGHHVVDVLRWSGTLAIRIQSNPAESQAARLPSNLTLRKILAVLAENNFNSHVTVKLWSCNSRRSKIALSKNISDTSRRKNRISRGQKIVLISC